MSLRYMCDEDERHLPMAQRSTIWVCDGDERIGVISADADESVDRNQSVAIWRARVLHSHFNPFNHMEDNDAEPDKKAPAIESDDEGYTALANPNKLNMRQARAWIKDHYHKARK